VWNGSELVVVGPQGLSPAAAIAFSFETGAWRVLPAPGLDGIALSATRDGGQVVFTDYEMHIAAWNGGSSGWTTLPSVPARFYEYTPIVVATPPTLLVTTANALVVRDRDRWIPVPRGDLAFWGGTGSVGPVDDAGNATLYSFGITQAGTNRLIRLDPTVLASSARTLQVGEVALRLPPDATLREAALDGTTTNAIDDESVRVELTLPTGSCTVSSTYVGQTVVPDQWVASEAGRVREIAATSSDLARVRCTDPEAARDLTTRISLPPGS
jgi:hypothetical protein